MKKADGWSMGQEEQKQKAMEEKLRRRVYTAAFEAAQQRKEKPWQSWDEAFSERLAKQPFITEEERKPFAPNGAGAQNAFYRREKQPWPGLEEAWPGGPPNGAGAQNAFYRGEKQPWPGLEEAWPGQARRAGENPWAALPGKPPNGAGTMLLAGQRRSMAQAAPGGEPPAGPEQGVPGLALEGVDPAYRDAVYAGQALAELLRPERRKAGAETGKALQPGGGYGTLKKKSNNDEEEANYQDTEWWLKQIDETRAERANDILSRMLDGMPIIAIGKVGMQAVLGVKGSEADLIVRHPLAALQINEAKDRAATGKGNLFPDAPDKEIDGAKANAFLHAYWNAAAAYRIGADLTEQFTTAHETYSFWRYLKYKDKPGILNEVDEATGLTIGQNVEMDMHNNAVGREIAGRIPTSEEEIHQELLEILGSEERINEELGAYKDFSQADLLLLFYTKAALDNGELIWLYNG